jgi:hypothetical protein
VQDSLLNFLWVLDFDHFVVAVFILFHDFQRVNAAASFGLEC